MKNIDIHQIKHLYYREKKSTYKIAKILGCSVSTIQNRMRQHNMPLRSITEARNYRNGRRSPSADLDITEIARLYFDEQLSLAGVGERMGVSGTVIRGKLLKAGYTLRGRREVTRRRVQPSKFTEADVSEMERLYTPLTQNPKPAVSAANEPKTQTYTPPQRLGKVFAPIPLLSPEEVTPERILQLRTEDDLTLDDIAAVCSLSAVDIYNILIENGGI